MPKIGRVLRYTSRTRKCEPFAKHSACFSLVKPAAASAAAVILVPIASVVNLWQKISVRVSFLFFSLSVYILLHMKYRLLSVLLCAFTRYNKRHALFASLVFN